MNDMRNIRETGSVFEGDILQVPTSFAKFSDFNNGLICENRYSAPFTTRGVLWMRTPSVSATKSGSLWMKPKPVFISTCLSALNSAFMEIIVMCAKFEMRRIAALREVAVVKNAFRGRIDSVAKKIGDFVRLERISLLGIINRELAVAERECPSSPSPATSGRPLTFGFVDFGPKPRNVPSRQGRHNLGRYHFFGILFRLVTGQGTLLSGLLNGRVALERFVTSPIIPRSGVSIHSKHNNLKEVYS